MKRGAANSSDNLSRYRGYLPHANDDRKPAVKNLSNPSTAAEGVGKDEQEQLREEGRVEAPG
eukprot:scaffold162253_cov29-Prasinocladus_malaysianus.AAC.1